MDYQECIQQSAGLNLSYNAADVFCKNMQSALKDCTWGYVDNQGVSYQNAREICKDEAGRYMPVGNWLANSLNNTAEHFSGIAPGTDSDDNPDDGVNQHSTKMPLWQIILITAGGILALGGAVLGVIGVFGKKNEDKKKTSKATVKDSKIRNDLRSNKISVGLKIEKQNQTAQSLPKTTAGSHLMPIRINEIEINPAVQDADDNDNHADNRKKKIKKRTKTTYNNELVNLKKPHKNKALTEIKPQSNSSERIEL